MLRMARLDKMQARLPLGIHNHINRRTLLRLALLLPTSRLFDVVATLPSSLNVRQVYQLLLNNGANQSEAATLAGISVWEAGGGNPNNINPAAINPVSPDYSVGLFQYNFRAGVFNAINPLASTRGGFSAQELLDSLNAQAQSALALLRGSQSGYYNWTTYKAHFSSIQGYINQLLGTSTANGSSVADNSGGTTDTQPGTGSTATGTDTTSGDTGVQSNPTSGLQSSTTTGASGASSPPNSNASGSALNLNFTDSISHSLMQILLVVIGIALLIGGIYLIGRPKL